MSLRDMSKVELRTAIQEIEAAVAINDAKLMTMRDDVRERERQNELLKMHWLHCREELARRKKYEKKAKGRKADEDKR